MYSIHCTGRICLPRAVKAALASLVAVVYLTGPSCADTLRNPAACGIRPWERSLRDVNLVNGNLFKSFTDIQVAPARGAGLVLQRSYNSNDGREGPFGVGWTHAYDIRTEDTDADTMERTDFFGGKHSYVREAGSTSLRRTSAVLPPQWRQTRLTTASRRTKKRTRTARSSTSSESGAIGSARGLKTGTATAPV